MRAAANYLAQETRIQSSVCDAFVNGYFSDIPHDKFRPFEQLARGDKRRMVRVFKKGLERFERRS